MVEVPMEKKKFLQSEYGKLFGLPYVNQSDIVMVGKFLNISTVYRDKTGTIVLDPFKQATNITNKILDVEKYHKKYCCDCIVHFL